VIVDTLLRSMLKKVLFQREQMCILMALSCYNWYRDGRLWTRTIQNNNNLSDNGYLWLFTSL